MQYMGLSKQMCSGAIDNFSTSDETSSHISYLPSEAPLKFRSEGKTYRVDGESEEPEPELGFHGRCLCRPALSA